MPLLLLASHSLPSLSIDTALPSLKLTSQLNNQKLLLHALAFVSASNNNRFVYNMQLLSNHQFTTKSSILLPATCITLTLSIRLHKLLKGNLAKLFDWQAYTSATFIQATD